MKLARRRGQVGASYGTCSHAVSAEARLCDSASGTVAVLRCVDYDRVGCGYARLIAVIVIFLRVSVVMCCLSYVLHIVGIYTVDVKKERARGSVREEGRTGQPG